MKTSARVWHCDFCGTSLYSEEKAEEHYRAHLGEALTPRIYGQCGDCGAWLTGIETVTHQCDEAEQRRASAGWGPVIAVVIIVAIIAAIIGRIMV